MNIYKHEYFASIVVFLAIVLFFALFRSSTTILPYTQVYPYASYEGFDVNKLPGVGDKASPSTNASLKPSGLESTVPSTNASLKASGLESIVPSTNASLTANGLESTVPSTNNDKLANIMNNVYKKSSTTNGGNLSSTSVSGIYGSEGFETLNGSNYSSTSDYVIDRFSQVNANGVSCNSSGLTNSKGPICLPDDLVNMLKTRGGNSACDSQIGK